MNPVSNTPSPWDSSPNSGADLELADRPGSLDRRRSGRGLELTPAEKTARRRNRRWLLGISIPSVVVLVLALLASNRAQNNEPTAPTVPAPAGYRIHNDGYFSYVVPSQWSNNLEFTDQVGDVDTSGGSGWAAEHIGFRHSAPVLGETPPTSLRAFGIAHPEPFALTGGHPITVPGAATAFAYTMVRPGFSASVVDAWTTRYDVEIWLVVHAPVPVADQILSSLRA